MVVMGRLALWWWSCIPWNRYSHRSAPNWSQWCVGGVFNGLKVQGVVVVAAVWMVVRPLESVYSSE